MDGADAELARAVRELREVDAKQRRAYLLTHAAEQDVARGALDDAEAKASEALAASEAVERQSHVALARAVLGDVALRRGDTAAAAGHVAAVLDALAIPLCLSARARAAITRISDWLDAARSTTTV